MQLTGIEIAAEAIACAKQSAAELGLTNLHFRRWTPRSSRPAGNVPELVLVNPPRRGIGAVRLSEPDGAGLHYLLQLQRPYHGDRYRSPAGLPR